MAWRTDSSAVLGDDMENLCVRVDVSREGMGKGHRERMEVID